jgi:2,3,4,5-tetrahydropyridine-2-carboxylate N-succinyltransferase
MTSLVEDLRNIEQETGTAQSSRSAWAVMLEQRFGLVDASDAGSLTLESETLIAEICDALEAGQLRIAEPVAPGQWMVHAWVKLALLTLGRAGSVSAQPGAVAGTEISTLGWIERRLSESRIPAGSYLRRGCYVAAGCSIMPPSVIQAGAYLAPRVRVDSHVLIGTGAQIGEDVVLGCNTMIGGVLLPHEALPVVLERGVIVGGNCGIYGSVHIGEETILRPGTVIQAGDGIYDPLSAAWIVVSPQQTLHIPAHVEIGMGVPPVEAFADRIQRLTPILLRREQVPTSQRTIQEA